MCKAIFKSIFMALLVASSAISYAVTPDAAIRNQAQQLYNGLQQYPQNISLSWLNNIENLLAQDDNSFSLIYAVCQQQTLCMSGAASFPVAAIGLYNELNVIKPAVQACASSNNPYNCLQKKANPVAVGMVTGDLNQLLFQLQAYLG